MKSIEVFCNHVKSVPQILECNRMLVYFIFQMNINYK